MAHKTEKNDIVEKLGKLALKYRKTIVIYTVVVTLVEILNNVISILSNLGLL